MKKQKPWCTISDAAAPGGRTRGTASAQILNSRTMQSTPESGARAGYDGAKRCKGAKVHAAVDTLGHLLALHVTPAEEQDRAQIKQRATAVPELTDQSVTLAYVDQGIHIKFITGSWNRNAVMELARQRFWIKMVPSKSFSESRPYS
jgi:hypothetical protein